MRLNRTDDAVKIASCRSHLVTNLIGKNDIFIVSAAAGRPLEPSDLRFRISNQQVYIEAKIDPKQNCMHIKMFHTEPKVKVVRRYIGLDP